MTAGAKASPSEPRAPGIPPLRVSARGSATPLGCRSPTAPPKRDCAMNGIVRIALARPLTFIVMAILIAIVGVLQAARTPVDIFPEHRRAGDRDRVAVYRPVARRHVGPHHHAVRARADDHGQRHRPYREPVDAGHRHREDLLPAGRRHPHRHRAGHVDLADGAEADAAGHHAAADPELQRLDRADPAARAVGPGPVRTEAVRPRAEPDPPAAWSRFPARRCPIRRAASSARCRSTSIRRRCSPRGCRRRTSATRSPARTRSTRPASPRSAPSSITSRSTTRRNSIEGLNDLPVKTVNGATIYLRDVAHVRDGSAPQHNVVHVDGTRSVLMTVLKNGATSTLSIVQGVKDKLPGITETLPPDAQDACRSATSRCS